MKSEITKLRKEVTTGINLIVARILINPDHWAFEEIEKLKKFARDNRESQLLIVKVNEIKYEIIYNPYPTSIKGMAIAISKVKDGWSGVFKDDPDAILLAPTYGKLLTDLNDNV